MRFASVVTDTCSTPCLSACRRRVSSSADAARADIESSSATVHLAGDLPNGQLERPPIGQVHQHLVVAEPNDLCRRCRGGGRPVAEREVVAHPVCDSIHPSHADTTRRGTTYPSPSR